MVFLKQSNSSENTLEKGHQRKKGAYAEDQAYQFLIKKGLSLMKRNYFCKSGEIDLIMKDKNYIVFVEVRYRKDNAFGQAAISIGYQKQQRLIKTAQHYLLCTHQYDKFPCRFDALLLSLSIESPQIEWVKDAFSLNQLF